MKQAIIEELDKMAKAVLPERDQQRWASVMDKLRQGEDPAMVKWGCIKTLLSYDGPDYQNVELNKGEHFTGMVVYKLGDLTSEIPARIYAVHKYSRQYKYDLNIVVPMSDGYHTVRLYNIEGKWLKKLQD